LIVPFLSHWQEEPEFHFHSVVLIRAIAPDASELARRRTMGNELKMNFSVGPRGNEYQKPPATLQVPWWRLTALAEPHFLQQTDRKGESSCNIEDC